MVQDFLKKIRILEMLAKRSIGSIQKLVLLFVHNPCAFLPNIFLHFVSSISEFILLSSLHLKKKKCRRIRKECRKKILLILYQKDYKISHV